MPGRSGTCFCVELPATATVTDALLETGLVDSRSAARRAVTEGGAYVNNVRVDDAEAPLSDLPTLHGSWIVLRRGKRAIAGVKLQS